MEPSIYRSSTPPVTGDGQIDDPADDQAEMPLTMAASVILTNLPKDASSALQGAGDLPQAKVTVHLIPTGSAPDLKQKIFKISSTQHFGTVINFVRKKIGAKDSDGVYCYVNSTFSPHPDELVGNLWRVRGTLNESRLAADLGDSVSKLKMSSKCTTQRCRHMASDWRKRLIVIC